MSEEAYTNPKKIILTYLSGISKLFVVINQETPTEIFIMCSIVNVFALIVSDSILHKFKDTPEIAK